MDEISLALNPPRVVKGRRHKRPIRLVRNPSPVWPLPALNGRAPVVLGARGDGIELAYARLSADDAISSYPQGTPSGTATHFMPDQAAVLSVDDGVITFAGRHGHGFAMIIDHGQGRASHYADLKSLACIRTDLYNPREQHVRAGSIIGYVGAPALGEFKRLYFELWRADRDRRFIPIDPRLQLREWALVKHHDQLTPAPLKAQEEAA